MADSKPNEGRTQRLIECSVCLDTYNVTTKAPKVLSGCGHTFCLACLGNVAEAGKINCPTCREKTALPLGRVDKLKTNYNTLDTLESSCEECRDQHWTKRCEHCSKNVCDACHNAHTKTGQSEALRVVTEARKRIRVMNNICEKDTFLKKSNDKAQDAEDKVRRYWDNMLQQFTERKQKDLQEVRHKHKAKCGGYITWKEDFQVSVARATASLEKSSVGYAALGDLEKETQKLLTNLQGKLDNKPVQVDYHIDQSQEAFQNLLTNGIVTISQLDARLCMLKQEQMDRELALSLADEEPLQVQAISPGTPHRSIPTYMFGYSQGNPRFFIHPVTAEGRLGKESDCGGWSWVYNTLTTFKIRSRTYVFGWSSEKHYYFIQELLPNGKLASETATGKFDCTYDTMKAMTIGGGTYLFGHAKAQQYLFAQELMDGGRLGEEVFNVTGADYDQMIPFVYGADTFMFTFHTNTKSWDIWSVDAHGVTVIDTGKWQNSYNHTIVSVKGRPYLFGIKQNGYWFLQRISPQGKMQEETGNGTWRNYYATLSYYCYGQRTYLFGQNSTGHRNWFLQEILEGGKMGKETDHGTFKYAYETIDFYAKYE